MKIFFDESGSIISFVVGFIVILVFLVSTVMILPSGPIIIFVLIVFVVSVFANFKLQHYSYIKLNGEKFVCRDKKRNIDIEAPRGAVTVSLGTWKKETLNEVVDIPVVTVTSHDGKKVSFANNEIYGFEWEIEQPLVPGFDIELDNEKWIMLIGSLGLFDKMKKKPIVIPENARGVITGILYIALFVVIGILGWFLYYAFYVDNYFQV